MKINGKSLAQPYVETVVFPRSNGPIAIKVMAVRDYSGFEKLVPVPNPPERTAAGGEKSYNVEDPEYRKKVLRRGLLRHYWMQVQSLLATDGISFEVVSLSEPDTWDKLDEEFQKSGFTPWETSRIFNSIATVNGLNDAKIKQAELDFLASQAGPPQASSPLPTSPIAALRSIQSGEPANAAK